MDLSGALNNWLYNQENFNELYNDSSDEDDDDDGNSSSSSSSDDEETERRPRSMKARFSVQDRYESLFYTMYLDPERVQRDELHDEDSYHGKKFRRRFRVPYSMFLDIVQDIKRANGLTDARVDSCNEETVKTNLLVLGSLRIVASGAVFDLVEEATNVSEETHRVFFHTQFCVWGDRVSKEWIKMPTEEEELRKIMYVYEKKGLPGCAGSIDCVHLIWDKCPAGLHSVCKGKGKFPTLAFQAIVSHTRKVLSVSQYFWGTINDRTIAMSDKTVNSFRRPGSEHAEKSGSQPTHFAILLLRK